MSWSYFYITSRSCRLRFTDLDKLNLVMVVWFWARVNFLYCPSCLKNDTSLKSGHDWLKNNHLVLLVSINLWHIICHSIWFLLYWLILLRCRLKQSLKPLFHSFQRPPHKLWLIISEKDKMMYLFGQAHCSPHIESVLVNVVILLLSSQMSLAVDRYTKGRDSASTLNVYTFIPSRRPRPRHQNFTERVRAAVLNL